MDVPYSRRKGRYGWHAIIMLRMYRAHARMANSFVPRNGIILNNLRHHGDRGCPLHMMRGRSVRRDRVQHVESGASS